MLGLSDILHMNHLIQSHNNPESSNLHSSLVSKEWETVDNIALVTSHNKGYNLELMVVLWLMFSTGSVGFSTELDLVLP